MLRTHRLLSFAMAAALALCGSSSPAVPADGDFLERYAATNRFRLGRPSAIHPAPDGKTVLFLRSGPRSFIRDLYELDLAGWAAQRARQAARQLALPLDDPYFVRLKHAALSAPQPATVLPYSYQLGAAPQAALAAALADVLGAGVQPQLANSLPLGAEDDLPRSLPPDLADTVVTLFSMTATPERETHGAFVRALAAALPPRCTLHVVVDESGFRRNLGTASDAPSRLQQRRSAWERLLQELSLPPPRFVDLAAGPAA